MKTVWSHTILKYVICFIVFINLLDEINTFEIFYTKRNIVSCNVLSIVKKAHNIICS